LISLEHQRVFFLPSGLKLHNRKKKKEPGFKDAGTPVYLPQGVLVARHRGHHLGGVYIELGQSDAAETVSLFLG
jgi:hypothetical protein